MASYKLDLSVYLYILRVTFRKLVY